MKLGFPVIARKTLQTDEEIETDVLIELNQGDRMNKTHNQPLGLVKKTSVESNYSSVERSPGSTYRSFRNNRSKERNKTQSPFNGVNKGDSNYRTNNSVESKTVPSLKARKVLNKDSE